MSSNRIPELDGLRGVGSLFVLAHHASLSTQLFWAWIWLEMFFVLSGFLITTILLRTDIQRPLAIRNFLIRRGLRIWPVYYVGLAAAFGIWLLYQWNNPGAYPHLEWWRYPFYLQFIEGYFTTDQSYMQNHAHWFRISWSLAVEEQYYVIWPLVVFMVRGRRALMFVFGVGVIATCLYMRATDHALNLLLTRGDGFVLGSMLAVLEQMARSRPERFRSWLVRAYGASIAIGLPAIAYYIGYGYWTHAVREYDDITRYGNWTWNVLAASLLFFGTIGLLRNGYLGWIQRPLSWRPFTYLGEISYPVYMYQTLVFHVFHQAERLVFGESVFLKMLAAVLSICVGQLSTRYLERPFNGLKRFFPNITPTGTTQNAITEPSQQEPSANRDGPTS